MSVDKELKIESKRCIILSQGPVPTPEHTQVEGGGLRCWGLAKGVLANSPDMQVTVAYHNSYKKEQFTEKFEGISIATWDFDTVSDLIAGYDTIIVSYCMGELSVRVADAIKTNQQLILDCYVPIYVEVSARDSANVEDEYRAFEGDVVKWDRVLKRGDLFLCANEPQKKFYQGVLAAVGRINPVTYQDDLILITPYGVYRDEPVANNKPITKLIGKDHDKYLKVLWFGGIYPWFDIRNLADAVKKVNETTPAKLIVVGAKNPFNKHPDFIARYDEFIDHVSTDEMKQYVIVQDWIDFNDRADWYLDADVVVVFNKDGEENKLAWRTRLVDFMWADLPILTNGGDPLGEAMLSAGAALKMESIDADGVAKTITSMLGKDRSKIEQLKKNMSKLKPNFYWDVVTAPLAAAVDSGVRAQDLEKMGVYSIAHSAQPTGRKIPVRRIVSKAKKVPAYANKYGYKATSLVVAEMVRRKFQSTTGLNNRKTASYVFVSHQLDMSGAPFIAIDMAIDFAKAGKPVEFFTYLPTHKENLSKLNKAGIKPRVLMSKDMVPSFVAGDTIVLNTIAHSETVKEVVFSAAESGGISLLWYLHEDDPELLFREDERKRIKKMLEKNQIKLLIAAHKMRSNYIEYFGTDDNIILLPYKHVVPSKFHRVLKSESFSDKLTFVLPGTVGDGRKGQLPIFYAFVQFYERFYKVNPKAYRNFELVFVGMHDDFLSRQIRAHAKALGSHFTLHGRVTWEEHLAILAQSNVTICYSIRECLPLFVFEGMISGHPILRNDSSGMEEQLVDGKNGFYLESNDFDQVVNTIEEVLNVSKTADKKLADMSALSYEIAKKQESNNYLSHLIKQ